MSIPGQSFNIRDSGRNTPPAASTFVYMGCSEKGSVSELVACADQNQVLDAFGEGSLSEDLCRALQESTPVYGVRLTGSVAGVAGSVTKTPSGTPGTGTITVAGAPFDAYSVQVVITAPGTVAVGEFQYTLDGGQSFSPSLQIPSGGTYPIPKTNLTLTFVPGVGTGGTFNLADLHTFTCTAPGFSTNDLLAGVAVLLAANVQFAAIVLSKVFASASAATPFAAAMSGHAASLFTRFNFVGFFIDAGGDNPATTKAGFATAAFADTRAVVGYGYADIVTSKPNVGWSVARRPNSSVAAARIASLLPSTDAANLVDPPLKGVLAITHDEAQTELMDQKKFLTLRTVIGLTGFYITNPNLMSPVGSDFVYWQHRRCLDIACATAYVKQLKLLSRGAAVNPDGTIKKANAKVYESGVIGALRIQLIDPDNAEGTPGHVSAVHYTVATDNNLRDSGLLKTRVGITPFGYTKQISTDIGFFLGG